jgi:delta1-piperideine-2-carboxylate reductase
VSRPTTEHLTSASIRIDGDGGFSPLALEIGVPILATVAHDLGVAVMSVVNSYHLAALWHEAEALAARDLIAIVAVTANPRWRRLTATKHC